MSEAPPATNESALSAPNWTVGQWWRWEIRPRDHWSYNITTVVAAEDDAEYIVGVTDVPAGLRSTSFHQPPQGPIAKTNLAWMEHGHPVDLLTFPLKDGTIWKGKLDNRQLTVTARQRPAEGDHLFEINSTFDDGGSQGPRGTYSTAVGNFVEYHHHYGGTIPFVSATLLDHGTGHAAPVQVFMPRDKFFGEALGQPDPPTPPGSFDATGPKDYLVFACFMAAGPGSFSASFVPPNGEETVDCELRNPQSAFQRQVRVQSRSTIDGTWRVLYSAVGKGWVGVEVLGVKAVECVPRPAGGETGPCAM